MAPSPNNNDASPPTSDSPPADNSSPPEASPSPPNNAPPGGASLPPTSSRGDPPPAPPGVNPNPVPGTPLPPGTPNAFPPKQPTKHAPARRSPNSRDSGSDSDMSKEQIVGAAVGAGLFILALIIICITCCCRKKKKKDYYEKPYYMDPNTKGGDQYYSSSQQPLNWQGSAQPPSVGWQGGQQHHPAMSSGNTSSNFSGPHHHGPFLPPPSPGIVLAFNKSTFTYDELAAATRGFSHSNLLGQGGFGYVHKGTLPNGKVIAVKSLKLGSGQGEREFQAEVEIISRVHHRHLVSLVGYCIAGGQRMLVYEFVSNNNLEYHLHNKNLPPMDWPSRLRIALGSAKGLAYLHEDCHPRIIHRDIKAANILLDDNFEAMVADFGLAKLSSDNNTHVSTRIMGTFGYLAPEYASSGKLTEKSDVYSYGIMLLELITGRRPVDNSIPDSDSLVDWARPLLIRAVEEGKFDDLVDPRLGNNFDRREMTRMASCAAASIRHSAKKRPKMSKIVHALEGDVSLDDLNEGTIPGHSNVFAKASDMDQHRKLALGSVEFSSEYGTSSSNDSR